MQTRVTRDQQHFNKINARINNASILKDSEIKHKHIRYKNKTK